MTMTKERWTHIASKLHVDGNNAPAGVVLAADAATNGAEIAASMPTWTLERPTRWEAWLITATGLLVWVEVTYDREWYTQVEEMQNRLQPVSQKSIVKPLNRVISIEYGRLYEIGLAEQWFPRDPVRLVFPEGTVQIPSSDAFNLRDREANAAFLEALRSAVGF